MMINLFIISLFLLTLTIFIPVFIVIVLFIKGVYDEYKRLSKIKHKDHKHKLNT